MSRVGQAIFGGCVSSLILAFWMFGEVRSLIQHGPLTEEQREAGMVTWTDANTLLQYREAWLAEWFSGSFVTLCGVSYLVLPDPAKSRMRRLARLEKDYEAGETAIKDTL